MDFLHARQLSWLFLPEEVIFAVDLVSLREAFITEMRLTISTTETLGMPRTIQNLQDEPVQDGLTASGTLGNGSWSRKKENVKN